MRYVIHAFLNNEFFIVLFKIIRFPQSILFLSKKERGPISKVKIYSKILKWGGLLYSTTEP